MWPAQISLRYLRVHAVDIIKHFNLICISIPVKNCKYASHNNNKVEVEVEIIVTNYRTSPVKRSEVPILLWDD